MLRVIGSVADMTAFLDRDRIVEAVGALFAAAINVGTLEFWDVTSQERKFRTRLRFRIPASEASADDPSAQAFRPVEPDSDFAACLNSKMPVERGSDDIRLYRYLFPICGPRGVSAVLRIIRDEPLRSNQKDLIDGLLRIYINHLKIIEYSEIDELTGLLNRKAFDERFGNLQRFGGIGSASAPNSFLAVADIDHFKRVNDVYGHLIGDEVIVTLAQVMRQTFREGDLLFRCGGEEFVILLEKVSERDAKSALNRFRTAIETHSFPQVGRVTVSLGFAGVRSGDNAQATFGRADQALYHVKQNGRNHVHYYDDLVSAGHLEAASHALNDVELF